MTMWAGRQAGDVAIHRFDAARGSSTEFEPHLSADGLDALLTASLRCRPIW